jgi:hypothetical protein
LAAFFLAAFFLGAAFFLAAFFLVAAFFFLATVTPPYKNLLRDRLSLINRAYDYTTNFSHELKSAPTVNRD